MWFETVGVERVADGRGGRRVEEGDGRGAAVRQRSDGGGGGSGVGRAGDDGDVSEGVWLARDEPEEAWVVDDSRSAEQVAKGVLDVFRGDRGYTCAGGSERRIGGVVFHG